jgi:Transglutaminase-like superfamily
MKTRASFLLFLFGVVCFCSLPSPGLGIGKMPFTTEVTVLDPKGKPASARQVILEFGDPKKPVFLGSVVTSAKGVAIIKHEFVGRAKVFVDEDHGSHNTTGIAPGNITVQLGWFAPYAAIDSHALKASPEDEKSVDSLAKYLAEPAKNDLDKARAIFRWITDRVVYDVEAAMAGKQKDLSTEDVLKSRKCVCQGFANLFDALAKKMGLEAMLVSGSAKLSGGIPRIEHGWNAVKIDGTWKLFDSTLGSGQLVNQKKLTKQTLNFYFQPDPELLLFSHFPDDSKWQLRDPPLAKEVFDAYPPVPRQILSMGFSAAELWKILKEDKIKEFSAPFATPGREVVIRDVPLAKTLKAGVKYRFLLEAPEFSALEFVMDGKVVSTFVKKGPLFEGFIAPPKGTMIVGGRNRVQPKPFPIIMQYQVE